MHLINFPGGRGDRGGDSYRDGGKDGYRDGGKDGYRDGKYSYFDERDRWNGMDRLFFH